MEQKEENVIGQTLLSGNFPLNIGHKLCESPHSTWYKYKKSVATLISISCVASLNRIGVGQQDTNCLINSISTRMYKCSQVICLFA